MPFMPPPAGPQPESAGIPGADGAGPSNVLPFPQSPEPGGGVPTRPATSEGDVDPAQVEEFIENGFQVIYGGDTDDGELSQPIASMLRRKLDDPSQSLANTAAQVATKVITTSMDGNVSLDPAAAFAGLMELVGELASVATEEGIYDYSQQETDAAAVRAGEVLYGLTQELDFFSQEEAMQDAGSIAAASQNGELDQAIGAMEQQGAAPPGTGAPIMGRP